MTMLFLSRVGQRDEPIANLPLSGRWLRPGPSSPRLPPGRPGSRRTTCARRPPRARFSLLRSAKTPLPAAANDAPRAGVLVRVPAPQALDLDPGPRVRRRKPRPARVRSRTAALPARRRRRPPAGSGGGRGAPSSGYAGQDVARPIGRQACSRTDNLPAGGVVKRYSAIGRNPEIAAPIEIEIAARARRRQSARFFMEGSFCIQFRPEMRCRSRPGRRGPCGAGSCRC